MIDLEELFERSDELRNILDESKKTELSEYLNRFTVDEISEFFGMLLIRIDDPEQAARTRLWFNRKYGPGQTKGTYGQLS